MDWAKADRDRNRAELAMALASYALDMPVDEVRLRQRGSRLAALSRQAAMYVCHVACGMPLSRVALAFRRDRSTVSHACHQMEDRREDPAFDAWIEALTHALRAVPGAADAERKGAAS